MTVDSSQLNQFASELNSIAKDFPKESREFLKKEAKEQRKVTLKELDSTVGEKTGHLREGIKDGKVYKYSKTGDLSARVYGGKPAYHAHLVDRGHRIVVPKRWRGKERRNGGEEKGNSKAFPFMENAAKEYEKDFHKHCEEFMDDLVSGRIGR